MKRVVYLSFSRTLYIYHYVSVLFSFKHIFIIFFIEHLSDSLKYFSILKSTEPPPQKKENTAFITTTVCTQYYTFPPQIQSTTLNYSISPKRQWRHFSLLSASILLHPFTLLTLGQAKTENIIYSKNLKGYGNLNFFSLFNFCILAIFDYIYHKILCLLFHLYT